MEQGVIVIGAGQAASTAVETLRKEGFTGEITLVGDEPELPYSRPPLSKKFLAGELAEERLLLKAQSFYDSHQVRLRLGTRATQLSTQTRTVTLDTGETLNYSKLLLCTGSSPRRVSVPGHDLQGIHYLRSKSDVARLAHELTANRRIVIVGAGYIGLEVAATCRQLGLQVDVLEMAERIMNRVVASPVSDFFAQEHAKAGVNIHTRHSLAGFLADPQGRVCAVQTTDGAQWPADLVLVGVGGLPNTELAARAGLTIDNGVAVDLYCQTSDPDVYAAGDCANQFSTHYQRRLRLESVDNAFEQAKTAAQNLLGKSLAHDKIPWFWSDQYDLKLLISGINMDFDQGVLRGDPSTRSFTYCYLRGNELLAVDCINQAKDYMASKRLIADRTSMDLMRLADISVPLREATAQG